MRKLLGEDTARTGDQNWPKGLSTLSSTMLRAHCPSLPVRSRGRTGREKAREVMGLATDILIAGAVGGANKWCKSNHSPSLTSGLIPCQLWSNSHLGSQAPHLLPLPQLSVLVFVLFWFGFFCFCFLVFGFFLFFFFSSVFRHLHFL